MAKMVGIINSCKNCGIYFRTHEERFPRLCDICALKFILGRKEDLIPSHAKEVPVVEIKKPKKRAKRVKRERRYLGRFDYIAVEDDGTGD